MKESFLATTLNKALQWSQAQSLWYISTGSGCCADEVLQTQGCRYDFERFGCLPQVDPAQADLLIISGVITYKTLPHIQALYNEMLEPKFVIAIGACACSGGAFGPEFSYSSVPGADRLVPVDVYVPGCPPRPEAVMNGLLALQNKIQDKLSGNQPDHRQT